MPPTPLRSLAYDFRTGLHLDKSRSNFLPDYCISHLWVDAISIDQENTKERSAQVSIMGSIFARASCTAIYLGAFDESAKNILTKMTTEFKGRQTEPLRRTGSYLDRSNFSVLLELVDDHKALFSRPWFTRTWVVQEALLSKKLTKLIGDDEFFWDSLKLAGTFLNDVDSQSMFQGCLDAESHGRLLTLCSKYDSRIHVVFLHGYENRLNVQREPETARSASPYSEGNSAISPDIRSSSTTASADTLESHLERLETSPSMPNEEGYSASEPVAFGAQTSTPSDSTPSFDPLLSNLTPPPKTGRSLRSTVELCTHTTEQHSVLYIPSKVDLGPVVRDQYAEGPHAEANKAFNLLLKTRHLNCRDPRDKIFALRSLFNTSCPDMAVDYARPLHTVFADLSWFLISHGIFFTLEIVCICKSEPREFPSWAVDWRSLPAQYSEDIFWDRFFKSSHGGPIEVHAKRRGSHGEEIALKGRILDDPILECGLELPDLSGTNYYVFRTSSGFEGVSTTTMKSGDRLCLFTNCYIHFIIRAHDTRWLLVGRGKLNDRKHCSTSENNRHFIYDADWTKWDPGASQTELQDIWLC